MRLTLDRATPHQIPRGSVTLRIGTGTIVTLGNAHLEVPGLARSDYVEIWYDDDWACLVGDRGEEIVGAWPNLERLQVIGTIDRLILDGYDPGGLNHVDLVELPGDGLLVVGEIAVVLVRSGGMPSPAPACSRSASGCSRCSSSR